MPNSIQSPQKQPIRQRHRDSPRSWRRPNHHAAAANRKVPARITRITRVIWQRPSTTTVIVPLEQHIHVEAAPNGLGASFCHYII